VIPASTVRRILTALGTPPDSPDELRELLEAVDPEESGYVSYEHFVAIAAIKLHQRTEDQKRDEIETAFQLFTGGPTDGKITLAALRRVARELKENINDELLKDMIQEANGGVGVAQGVDLDQFEGVMRRAGVFK
jgi:hydroxyacylglutathione hydrolase